MTFTLTKIQGKRYSWTTKKNRGIFGKAHTFDDIEAVDDAIFRAAHYWGIDTRNVIYCGEDD